LGSEQKRSDETHRILDELRDVERRAREDGGRTELENQETEGGERGKLQALATDSLITSISLTNMLTNKEKTRKGLELVLAIRSTINGTTREEEIQKMLEEKAERDYQE
jgi:hypothetical protein